MLNIEISSGNKTPTFWQYIYYPDPNGPKTYNWANIPKTLKEFTILMEKYKWGNDIIRQRQ